MLSEASLVTQRLYDDWTAGWWSMLALQTELNNSTIVLPFCKTPKYFFTFNDIPKYLTLLKGLKGSLCGIHTINIAANKQHYFSCLYVA